MRNPALNEKIRYVDLGVAVCVDAMIRHAEALQAEDLTAEQAEQHKAQIRHHASIYQQAIDGVLAVLDAESEPADFAKNPQNVTACKLPKSFTAFPHIAPLNLSEEKTLDDKLNLFHSLLLTFATLPEQIQQHEIYGGKCAIGDIAEVYKVYAAYLSDQFSHLHQFAQAHYNAKGGSDERD